MHFQSVTYNCPYHKKCNCYKVLLLQAGEHGPESHIHCWGVLSVKQRGTIKRAVRVALKSVGGKSMPT